MPTYGDEKRLEMARSILPASARARKPAREHRARVHRAVRAKVRMRLATAPLGDDFDADDAIGPDARRGPYGGTEDLVQRRRNADKLGPFLRWAGAHADGLGDTPDARVAALRRVLPAGLIGDHAISHVRRHPGFRVTPDWIDYAILRWKGDLAVKARYLEGINDKLKKKLVENLDRVGVLNRRLKACHNEMYAGGPPRVLHGAHDVDTFASFITRELAEVETWPPSERELWRRERVVTTLTFCDLPQPPWWR